MNERPSITAFFPACNDAGTIASMVIMVEKTLATLTDDYEVLIVENGSTDYTLEVLHELARRSPHVRVLHYDQPLGYGGALRQGFAHSSKDLIFYTDGDAQYDPREVALLLPMLDNDIAMVNGWKLDRQDPVLRIIIGRLYNRCVKLLFGLRLKDVDCDFRLIRRHVFDVIDLESDSGTICLELVRKIQDAQFRVAEVPVHHYHRSYGKSQFFNIPRLWRTAIQLSHLWWKLIWLREHLPRIAERRALWSRNIPPAPIVSPPRTEGVAD